MMQDNKEERIEDGQDTRKKTVRKILLIGVTIVAVAALIVYAVVAAKKNRITSLNVVTQPLLMNEEYAQDLLEEMWAEIEPDIELNFVERSYASVDYPEEIDVLEFDFENIQYLSSKGYFHELNSADIEALDDLIPFAKENITVDGKIYGVPQLLCGNYLVYHRGDAEMDEVENFADLIKVMKRGHTEELPVNSDADKVWIDFGSQYAYYALDGVVDDNESYEPFTAAMVEEHMPTIYDLFDGLMDWSIETETGNVDPAAFGAGRGRAMLCYSEKIWQTGFPAEDLVIRPISFSDDPNIPLAYIDSVAISDWVKDEKRYEKCLELVNLMTGKEYVERLLMFQGKPQYLVPARNDVFKEYAEEYPLYAELYDRLVKETPYQFRAGNENLQDLMKWIWDYRKKRDEEQETGVDEADTTIIPGLAFRDGMAQPIFSSEDADSIVRYSVWVETDNDIDSDGSKDLVKAMVQVPRPAYEGKYKAAAIYEGDPSAVQAWKGELDYESRYDYFLDRGFAVVTSTGPGTLGSDGYVTVGSKEEADAFAAIIEWIHGDRKAYADRNKTETVKAEWSNGKTGMTGSGYAGAVQYELAARGVKGLEAVVPVEGITDWYSYWNDNGISLEPDFGYVSRLSRKCSAHALKSPEFMNKIEGYFDYLSELDDKVFELKGDYGEFWEERSYTDKLEDNTVAFLVVHGTDNDDVRPNQILSLGEQLWEKGYEYKMIFNQGTTLSLSGSDENGVTMIADMSYDDILNKWFSHYLYAIDNGIQEMPQIQYQSNIDGTWDSYSADDVYRNTASFNLEAAILSSKDLPKNEEDWNDEVWHGKNNSAVKRYEITTAEEDGMMIFENSALKLNITLDNIPENQDNLMVSAYLVDEYDEPFETYSPSGNIVSDYQVISRLWFDLCNPYEGDTSNYLRKRENPVQKGQTYDYFASFDPAMYYIRPGHKLILYIFSYDIGRVTRNLDNSKLSQVLHHKFECEYGFTINKRSNLLTVLKGHEIEQASILDPSEYELKETKKILIDSDTAGDDAMAIMMAAKSEKIDLLGVTVLPGNVDMKQALDNALMTLEVAGCDAPVYAGSETFITGEVPSTFSIFGKDGMGDCGIIHPTRKAEEGSGIDFIIDTIRENPDEVEIVEIGPCTNLARAIQKAPDIMKRVKKIWIMGSAGQGVGNATPVSEFNIYKDAEAVKIVLESGIPIVFVGWDMALDNRTYFYYEDMLNLAKDSEEGKFMISAFTKLAENKLLQYGRYFIDLADPIAMAACIWPDYITSYKTCYGFCCTNTDYMPVYGQVVFYDKDKTYDAKFEVPEANCELAASQKADEFVERITELLHRSHAQEGIEYVSAHIWSRVRNNLRKTDG